MKEASNRGQELGLKEEELAFYDALETNDSAVAVLRDKILKQIAQELTRTIRNNVTTDWTLRACAEKDMEEKEEKCPVDLDARASL